jgi:hypothetical protein
MPASTTPTAPGSGDVADALEPLRPAVAEVALFEWGTLVVRAGRNGPVLPHMVWLNRFSETIPREALEAEAQRLGSIPYGFGRRLLPARLPGGRPRWRASIEVPPVLFNDTPVAEGDELSAWVNGHLAMRLDPEHGPGWRMACTWTEDGHTIVMIFVHHIYGIAGGLLGALYGGSGVDPTDGTTGLRFDDPANDYTLAAERADGNDSRRALGRDGRAVGRDRHDSRRGRGRQPAPPCPSGARRPRRASPSDRDADRPAQPRGRRPQRTARRRPLARDDDDDCQPAPAGRRARAR